MMRLLTLLIPLFLFQSCVNEPPTRVPKPRMYPKVEYPKKDFKRVQFELCPFSFEMPTYSILTADEGNKNKNVNCWFNIDSPDFNAQLHCSYYPINNKNDLEHLVDDAYKLVQKHNSKADYIDQHTFKKNDSVTGVVYVIEGPAASPFQFFLTDSTHHFLRGALYINTATRPDSLKPIQEFLEIDVIQMMNTFEWE